MKALLRSLTHLSLPLCAVLLAGIVPPGAAPAATFTWDGGGTDGSMATAQNWAGDVAPSNPTGSINAYVFDGNTNLAPLLTGDYGVSSITFAATAGAFNLKGGTDATTLRFSMQPNSVIEQDSASNETISAYLLFFGSGNTTTVQGSGAGTLTLAGISDTGSAGSTGVLAIDRDTIFGNYRGSNVTKTALRVHSGVTLTFSGATTKSSVSANDLPVLQINGDGGAAAATIQAATAFSTTAAVQANNATFAGSKAMTFSGNYTQEGTGDETVSFTNTGGTTLSGTTIQLGATGGTASRTVTFSTGTGATATISGGVTGSVSSGLTSISKTGAGTLILSGTDTINGTVNVTTGKAAFNGTFTGGNVSVATGATLAGTGTLNATAGSIAVSGTVAPGDVGSIGTLHLSLNAGNKLNFASGSTLALDVNASTSDQLSFASAGDWLAGAGDLTLALSGTIDYSKTYTVFSNVTTAGFTLAGVTGLDGAHTAVFTQNGSVYQLSFATAPEPSAAWLLPLGGLLFLARRRDAART